VHWTGTAQPDHGSRMAHPPASAAHALHCHPAVRNLERRRRRHDPPTGIALGQTSRWPLLLGFRDAEGRAGEPDIIETLESDRQVTKPDHSTVAPSMARDSCLIFRPGVDRLLPFRHGGLVWEGFWEKRGIDAIVAEWKGGGRARGKKAEGGS